MGHSFSVSKLKYWGPLTLSNFLDWMVALVLTVLFAIMALQLGGVRAETRMLSSWLTGFLLGLHGLWQLTCSRRGKTAALDWRCLYFVPLLIYICLQWWLLSPASWVARQDALLAIQAFVVLWVAVHNLRTFNHIVFMFLVMGVLSLTIVIMGFNQYFRDIFWLPIIFNPIQFEFSSVATDIPSHGGAIGSFESAGSFAGLLLLAFFPLFLCCLVKRWPTAIKFMYAYISLMIGTGLLMSLNYSGLIVFIFVLLWVPWFCGYKPRTARLFKLMLPIIIAVILAMAFFSSRKLQERWQSLFLDGDKGEVFGLWQTAWHVFQDHSVFGSGLGTFRYYLDVYRPEGYNVSLIHAQNGFLEFASDTGLVGLLLLLGPLLFIAFRGWATWRALPDSVPLDELKRNRRRMRVMPTQKLCLSIGFLSLLAFALHVLTENHLYVPGLVLWAAFFTALVVKSLPEKWLPISWMGARALYVAAVGAIALGFALLPTRGYIAEIYVTEARGLDQWFRLNFNELSYDSEFHQIRTGVLEEAINLNPDHAEAQALLALAIADTSYAEPLRRKELGAMAEEHARIAVGRFPDAPRFQIALGRALDLQGKTVAAEAAYTKAVETAPHSDVAWYHYAKWLSQTSGRQDEAPAAIDKALALNPENEAAKDLRLKILIP